MTAGLQPGKRVVIEMLGTGVCHYAVELPAQEGSEWLESVAYQQFCRPASRVSSVKHQKTVPLEDGVADCAKCLAVVSPRDYADDVEEVPIGVLYLKHTCDYCGEPGCPETCDEAWLELNPIVHFEIELRKSLERAQTLWDWLRENR